SDIPVYRPQPEFTYFRATARRQIGPSVRVYKTCPAAFSPKTLVHALHDFLPAPASPGRHLPVPVLLSGKAHLTWRRITIAKYHTYKRQASNLAARSALLVDTLLRTQRPVKKTFWAQLPNTISVPPELDLLGCHPEDDKAADGKDCRYDKNE